MTIKSLFEIPIDERIDVVLAWLEKDIKETLPFERFGIGDLRISFYYSRKDNTIEIKSRVFVVPKDELSDGESVAKFQVLRITDIADDKSYNRSIIKCTCDVDHPQYEKIAYFYLARLGVAFKTDWKKEMAEALEAIKAEIEKKQGGHWGYTDWKVDEKTGRRWRIYGLIPNAPEPAQNTQAAQPTRIDKENITLGELEERIQAGDKEAIEFWEKEMIPILKEMAEALAILGERIFDTPSSKQFLELLKAMYISKNPLHRAVIRPYDKWSLKKLKEYSEKWVDEELAKSANELPASIDAGTVQVDVMAPPKEPPKPPEPKESGGKINLWLDWYHAMIDNGYKCTLEDVAKKSGYSLGYIKQKHMIYQARPNQITNQI